MSGVRQVTVGPDEADQRLLEKLPPTLARLLSGLTPQERRILELYGEGLTHDQIAEQLYLARATVRTYLGAIGRKLGWDDHRED